MQSFGDEGDEKRRVCHHKAVDSVFFNIGGRLFMIQQELAIEDQLGALSCQVREESLTLWSNSVISIDGIVFS